MALNQYPISSPSPEPASTTQPDLCRNNVQYSAYYPNQSPTFSPALWSLCLSAADYDVQPWFVSIQPWPIAIIPYPALVWGYIGAAGWKTLSRSDVKILIDFRLTGFFPLNQENLAKIPRGAPYRGPAQPVVAVSPLRQFVRPHCWPISIVVIRSRCAGGSFSIFSQERSQPENLKNMDCMKATTQGSMQRSVYIPMILILFSDGIISITKLI